MPFEYYAKVKEVIDGDTVVADIDLGFNVVLSNQKIRLNGIDTPESRTSDKVEKHYGVLSKNFTKAFIDNCKDKYIIVKTEINEETEKFGRVLGRVFNPDTKEELNEALIKNHLAVKYNGESKELVREMHLENRKILDSKK
jgi:micrococcal nuclease